MRNRHCLTGQRVSKQRTFYITRQNHLLTFWAELSLERQGCSTSSRQMLAASPPSHSCHPSQCSQPRETLCDGCHPILPAELLHNTSFAVFLLFVAGSYPSNCFCYGLLLTPFLWGPGKEGTILHSSFFSCLFSLHSPCRSTASLAPLWGMRPQVLMFAS